MLTVEQVEAALPAHLNVVVDEELVDQLNNLSTDPMAAEAMRNNFISFSNVLREGKFKLDDYANAISYVSFKIMGYSDREAYQRCFPQRYQRLIAEGKTDKDISAYVSAFKKNKLVTMIMERAYIPLWLVNQDAAQQAINVQVELMNDTKVSAKVRSDAANSLLTHLKPPEKKQVQLEIGIAENTGMADMKRAIRELAEQQSAAIMSGTPTKQIAQARIIEAEIIDESEN